MQNNAMQEDIEKELNRRIQYEYSVKLSELTNEIEILKVREQYHRKSEDYVKDLQEEKNALKKRLQELDSENKTLQDEIKKTMQKEQKSLRDIGKEGEACVKNLLDTIVTEEFKKVVVTDVSHIGHAGDFHLSLMTPEKKRIKILIDSKKYTSAVTNISIRKIMSDVDDDDEVTAGLLISTDSAISAKNQFQVEKTPKCKPLLYLTFEDLEDEMRGYVLCLAVRTIITLVSGYSELEKDVMIDNIELFLKEVEETVKDLNSLAIQCKKMNESILKLRMKLIEKINKFQSLTETPDTVEMEEIIEVDESIESTTRCKGSTKNGARCKFSCTMNSEYCQKHSK
jgi:predicted nuclease with TOPRIM domain